MQRQSLEKFVLACPQVDSLSCLWQLALDFFHSRAITMVSYHSDDAQRAGADRLGIVADGFPAEWICQYTEAKLHLVDPIPGLAARLARPFLWSQAGEIVKLTPEQQQYLSTLVASDLGDGLALQVYGPNTRNAYVGLGFGGPAPELTEHEIFELQCAAQIAHLRYCKITEDRQSAVDLSPRELEILRWMARGKSNSVIADILGISRHTVDTMSRRMFDKLEVHDRTTAAIRGLGAGLLQYRRQDVM